MKPVIGITTDHQNNKRHILNNAYINAVLRAGGLPIILPIGIEKDIKQMTDMLDGLLITGGGDIDPALFNEEPHVNLGEVSPSRDSVEIALTRDMLSLNKPIFGICRGLQILIVAVGGSIYQDIHSQINKPLVQHSQKAPRTHPSHSVKVEKGSLLQSIIDTNELKVNSFHHQAAKDVPKPLIISGTASDGIIEAIESTTHSFVLGVQWHPEALGENGEEVSLRLFNAFIEKCTESRK